MLGFQVQPKFRFLFIVTTILITVGIANGSPTPTEDEDVSNPHPCHPATLPVYKLSPGPCDEGRAVDLAQKLYGVKNYITKWQDSSFVLKGSCGPGSQVTVEVDKFSGGIWSADLSQNWKPTLYPSLPTDEEARKIADDVIAKYGPNLDSQGPFKIGFASIGHTTYASKSEGCDREDRKLDTRVNYVVTVNHSAYGEIPIVGGGAKFQVGLGDKGRLISYYGTWRVANTDGDEHKVIPKEVADAKWLESNGVGNMTWKSYLAYFAAPIGLEQQFLYPVYVYESTQIVNGKTVQVRSTRVPATDFCPVIVNIGPLEVYEKPRKNGTVHKKCRHGVCEDCIKECGVEYLTMAPGLASLSKTQANAVGFLKALEADGWKINFKWSNQNVWRSDWTINNDVWVDGADFVFYTGHAGGDGWYLGDGSLLAYNQIGPNVYGDTDLEWLVIAACGPFQDDIIEPGEGDAYSRWNHVFNGLHLILGYATVSDDTDLEGTMLISNARQGYTLLESWFKTAAAAQNSDVYAAAMWVHDAYNDHLNGYGPISEDVKKPTSFGLMWAPC
ncbi:hypothetical protein BC938DRAFT_480096 [Jimgerdemannia flammicorona]|uniref:Gingipain domain-containing protein n=1 Tax=Jimgerdemannia flammicorona TaxID=994334 RepID=A0A433QXG5_9FUNG|nr:hypothetical protein BC938DRAFT_480096 [Jimgerdemannia flammicorona]